MQCRRVFWPTQSSSRQADGAENERFPDQQGKDSEPPSCARWGFICTAWLGIRLSKWARLGCNLGAAGRSSRDLVAVSPLHRGVSSSGPWRGASRFVACQMQPTWARSFRHWQPAAHSQGRWLPLRLRALVVGQQ
ncbi:hypothetical protein L1887_43407 [Cichorium endivia]|nr:hypothetical protein L1887_43407 [Cichorium endivia]